MSGSSETFINRVIGFSLASWVNCIISLIATPITTAFFPPEELGKIALFISYANILIPFVYMGFDQAYVRFYNDHCGKNDKYGIFKICSFITILFAVIVSVLVLVGWRYFSTNIVGYPNFWISLSLAVYIVAFLFSRMCNLKSRMDNNVRSFCLQSVISTIIIKMSFVMVVIIKPSAEYALYLRSLLLMIAFGWFFTKAMQACKNTVADWSNSVLKELSKFSLPLFPTTFLVMLNASLAQIMLRKYVDFSQMGIFSNAVTIAALITIVQSGLNAFWTPFVYEYYKDPSKIQKMHHIFSLLMFIMALFIILLQDPIYYFLVDESYWQSKTILALLVIAPVSDVLAETLGLGIELSKKTYLKLPIYVINIVVNVLACMILIPQFGILGAAIASAMASLSMLVSRAVIGEHFYKCSDNYIKLIVSMILLIGTGLVNYHFHSFVYVETILSIIIVALIYRKECIIITKQGHEYIVNKLSKKNNRI